MRKFIIVFRMTLSIEDVEQKQFHALKNDMGRGWPRYWALNWRYYSMKGNSLAAAKNLARAIRFRMMINELEAK